MSNEVNEKKIVDFDNHRSGGGQGFLIESTHSYNHDKLNDGHQQKAS